MSIVPPIGVLDITNAVLRTGKIEMTGGFQQLTTYSNIVGNNVNVLTTQSNVISNATQANFLYGKLHNSSNVVYTSGLHGPIVGSNTIAASTITATIVDAQHKGDGGLLSNINSAGDSITSTANVIANNVNVLTTRSNIISNVTQENF